MSIVKEYLDLTAQWKKEYGDKTVLLMQVGSFFEVYALINPNGTYMGSNIEDIAKINDMVIAKKNSCVGKLQVVMAGVGVAYVDKYIERMQEHGYTIVIYKQDINGKNTTRSLAEIISPGTFFPCETENLSNNIMCIWLHKSNATKFTSCQVTLGIANIDIYTGKTSLFQYGVEYEHNSATYDELERYISAYRPSECLFVANMPEKIVDDIIGFIGLTQAKIHKIDRMKKEQMTKMETFAHNAEKQIYQHEILKKFYPHLTPELLVPAECGVTHYVATQAFCFLLDFVHQHSPNLVKKLAEPKFENYTDRLVLANHSLQQLNMLDDARHTGRLRSVSALLNNCVTTMGKRQFMYHLHYPTTRVDLLRQSYAMTEHLLQQNEWQYFRTILSAIGDLEKFSRKMVTGKILPKNLVALVDNLTHLRELYEKTQRDPVLVAFGYLPTAPIDAHCLEIMSDIQTVFCLTACQNVSEITESTVIINKGISPLIDELQKANMDGYDKLEAIRAYLSTLVQQSEKKTDANNQYIKIHENAKTDAVLMGTSRRVAFIKATLKKNNLAHVTLTYRSKYSEVDETFVFYLTDLEYVTNGSNKKDLVITNAQIKEITGENQRSKDKLIREMQRIFQNYMAEFSKFEAALTEIIDYTTKLDLLQCKCFIAQKYNYCKPILYESAGAGAGAAEKSFYAFTGIRHPLIEHLQTHELYVTNDMELGSRAAAANGILLYGTNAVGKTSFIKSIGIAIIMAQAGLYVPCTSFTYKPYQNIFTRILGNDNLFKGLSTFAVEMTELRTILLMANKHSLVLGDELCSGTESDSALSIFTAGLELLHEKECTFLFATHFHEIVKYEEIKALTKLKMYHMAVHYNKETNTLVYDRKLHAGSGESMYGLEVCKSLNLPQSFLERAHDIRMKYKPEQQNILAFAPTHFNAKKLVGNCEICKGNKASEVHHLQHQKNAQTNNDYINTFHKNHVANLINICEECHKLIHKTGQQHKIIKTTAGYKITAC
jgi:DNA mismatch repair protein MutS